MLFMCSSSWASCGGPVQRRTVIAGLLAGVRVLLEEQARELHVASRHVAFAWSML